MQQKNIRARPRNRYILRSERLVRVRTRDAREQPPNAQQQATGPTDFETHRLSTAMCGTTHISESPGPKCEDPAEICGPSVVGDTGSAGVDGLLTKVLSCGVEPRPPETEAPRAFANRKEFMRMPRLKLTRNCGPPAVDLEMCRKDLGKHRFRDRRAPCLRGQGHS